MYPLSYFYDKYHNELYYHYFDERKYHLENKIVTLPILYPAFYLFPPDP
jgi:hypothetical protein